MAESAGDVLQSEDDVDKYTSLNRQTYVQSILKTGISFKNIY